MQAARKAKRRPTLPAVLAMLLLLSGAAYAAASGSSAKPGITVQISPASQSVERAKAATYTVTLTSTGGFAGSVHLSAGGLPSGATANFAPATRNLTSHGSGSTATSVLSVTTTSSTPIGSYTVRVTGTSSKISGSITAGLTVIAAPSPGSLSMTATPDSVTIEPGESAAYAIQLVRTNLSGAVTFSVSGRLPSGMTASFSPNPTTGNSSTLTVTTTGGIHDDTYDLFLVASGKDATNVTRSASGRVHIEIRTSQGSFTISGNLSGLLAPGRTLPLQLSLTNPNHDSLSVTNLSVTLQSLTRTAYAISNHQPCSIGDYAVIQFQGHYPLVVSGSSTKSLSQLGVASGQWPQIQFMNTPVNQDGCKGATLSLSYSGSGQGDRHESHR